MDLAAGEKVLTAQAEGYITYTATVTIEPGETVTHNIYMERLFFPGFVAHYKFNGDATDSSGNGYHGTVHGATLVEDRFGVPEQAFYFDGVDDYIEVECQSFIKADRKEISVLAWMKIEANDDDTERVVVSGNDFCIYQRGNRIEFSITVEPQSTQSAWKEVTPGEWFHLAGTYDNETIRLHINGADPRTWYNPGVIANAGKNLNFGRDIVSGESIYWKVTIDDFQIYDQRLTIEEINELMSVEPYLSE
jgi:hypothetical protein